MSTTAHESTVVANTQAAVSSALTTSALEVVDADRYLDRVELARGGMGRIVAAYDRRLNRKVAIKEMRTQAAELHARFEREALLTARLEHPSIVGVHEAGRWPSGEPFYAMQLVSGRSLESVLADTPTFEGRVALVPHVIAVADALAYAHQKRVIHRDLKPHNVMIGEFGETIVIDWGLAKDLGAAEEPGAAVSSDNEPAVTEIGVVIGTPAYMPPEQAAGVSVDERADVYAIGAILYHTLAGTAPYEGNSSAEIVAKVCSDAPPSLVARQPRVPPDLLAIVERAMARSANERYATAKALADDLRRFQAGQLVGAHRYTPGQLLRRWLWRHRGPVAVAAVAFAVLAVLGVLALRKILAEERRADAERSVAQERSADAEQLMGFMLIDLKEKLEPIGKLALLDGVAKQATSYFARRSTSAGDTDRRHRAIALRNLADINVAQGDTAGALAQYRASLAIIDAADVTDEQWQLDRSRGHASVGDVLLEQGNTTDALAEYRVARTINEAWVAKAPSNLEWQRKLAVTRNKTAQVLRRQHDVPGALVEFRAALAIRERIVAADPANPTRQRDLSISHDGIGDVLSDQGDAVGALVHYREAHAIRARLAALDPTDRSRQYDLSASHDRIGIVLLAQNDAEAAFGEFRAELAIQEALVAHDPSNSVWQRGVARAQFMLADVYDVRDDATSMLAALDAAIAIDERLVDRDPTNRDLLRELWAATMKRGDLLRHIVRPAEAIAALRRALELAEKLAANDPKDVARKRELGLTLFKLGRAYEWKRKISEAKASFVAALEIAQTLVKLDPNHAQWKSDSEVYAQAVARM